MRTERDATSLVRMVDRDLLRPFQRGGYSKALPAVHAGTPARSGRGAGIGVVDEDTGSSSSPPGPIGYGRIGATFVGGGRATDTVVVPAPGTMPAPAGSRARHARPSCLSRSAVGIRSAVGPCGEGRRATQMWSRWVVSYGVSSVAQGMPLVVVVAVMHDAGRSALWVTIAAAARLVPYVVCSPAAGVLAGRHRFGVVCRTASVVRLGMLFVLTVLVVTRPQPVLLVATLFVLTAAGTPVYPGLVAATRAVMPVERLAAANAVTAAVESAAFVTGPALAGLLLATFGHSVVMVTACGLMAVAAVLADRRADPTTPRLTAADRHRLSVDISAAARLLGTRSARPAVATLLAVNALAGLEAVVLVTVADVLLDAGTAGYEVLAAASGAGAVIGVTLALGNSTRSRLPESSPVFVVVAALSLAALGAVGSLAVAAVVVGVAGTAAMLAEISAIGRLQRRLAEQTLAAAFGVLDSIVVLAMLAGAGIAPIAIATIGARPTLVLCGAMVASLPLLTDRPRHQRTSAPSTSQQGRTTVNHQRLTRRRTKAAVAAAALVVVAAGIAGSPAPAAESRPSTPIEVGHGDGLRCLLGTGTTTCTDLSI